MTIGWKNSARKYDFFFAFCFLVWLGDNDISYMKNVSTLKYEFFFLSWFIVWLGDCLSKRKLIFFINVSCKNLHATFKNIFITFLDFSLGFTVYHEY